MSKQREILLGDGGSEDEEQEDQEEPYMDRRCLVVTPQRPSPRHTTGSGVMSVCFPRQRTSLAATRTSWWRTTMTAITASPRREARR